MMHCESKEIYGVDVLGLVAVWHQLRRWWLIGKLRKRCKRDRKLLVLLRRRGMHLATASLGVDIRYKRIRLCFEYHQQRGDI
ncbi:hypothetical protein CO695_17755 [Providencia alcalifaciens]|uniref:Uncharacterized protein n=1 Tax=Providencia alcalifaciens DSM 30120 TaxID=520999 RepID=B6XBP9_9GAMM|nr:hypothetical protein [Providencia alcalifaciens]ATG18056.1 hypothetical protein CO695_17755 [Providencia alcalifaciens]EEB47051.1 hypothetical protein PROVALCAL_00760 [Providencia alcalifaciens DSM 30120]SQI33486.1 Uncharacterised protein [Providencia alcalifaciens]